MKKIIKRTTIVVGILVVLRILLIIELVPTSPREVYQRNKKLYIHIYIFIYKRKVLSTPLLSEEIGNTLKTHEQVLGTKQPTVICQIME